MGAWDDLRHSIRGFQRSPGIVVVSAISLGLGIGVNAMLYMGIAKTFGHEPTMRSIETVVGVEPGNSNQFSYLDYEDLRARHIFDDAVGFRISNVNLRSEGRSTRTGALLVTPNFFDVLGISARYGRTFSAGDAPPGHDVREVVTTSSFWRGHLHADPAAIGAPLVINSEPFIIVGVLPDDFRAVTGFFSPDLYVPVSRVTMPEVDDRAAPGLTVLARLPRSLTPQAAAQGVSTLMASLEQAYPNRVGGTGRPSTVFPASELQFRGTGAGFWLLGTVATITAGLVLLIACVNVAGLLLARVTTRRRELAIRAALGAGTWRIVRAMLIESLLLVVVGAAVGLPLVVVLTKAPFSPLGSAQNLMALDTRIVPGAILIVLLSTVICCVFPATKVTFSNALGALRDGGDVTTPRMRLREALVGAQVAMAFLLTVTAFLCVRSQLRLTGLDLGFDLTHGIVANFGLGPNDFPGQQRVRLAERLVDRLEQIPGVSSASVASLTPLGGDVLIKTFHPAGRTDIAGTRPDTFSVGPGYFKTLAIPLIKGRDFTRRDTEGSTVVAIVNETFARTYFPDQDAIGQRVDTADEKVAEVIGVVRDHRIGTIGEAPKSVIYYAYAQRPVKMIIHVRTTVLPESLVASVQAGIDEIEQHEPLSVGTLRDAARMELNLRKEGVSLLGTVAAVAVLLALIGLYGVMRYVAASRAPEIGIRMALGASRQRIRADMLRRALIVVIPGIVVGALAASWVTPALRTFLIGISPLDMVAFVAAAVFLLTVGVAASYGPAQESAKVDPMRVLRRL